MSELQLSGHAAVRANQRGIPHHLLNTLLEIADIDAPVGRSCRVLRVSRKRLKDPAVRNSVGSAVDRLARLAVIWSDRWQCVVTVLHHEEGHAGRRYRTLH